MSFNNQTNSSSEIREQDLLPEGVSAYAHIRHGIYDYLNKEFETIKKMLAAKPVSLTVQGDVQLPRISIPEGDDSTGAIDLTDLQVDGATDKGVGEKLVNQDAIAFGNVFLDGKTVVVAAVADGIGSSIFSEYGAIATAAFTCARFLHFMSYACKDIELSNNAQEPDKLTSIIKQVAPLALLGIASKSEDIDKDMWANWQRDNYQLIRSGGHIITKLQTKIGELAEEYIRDGLDKGEPLKRREAERLLKLSQAKGALGTTLLFVAATHDWFYWVGVGNGGLFLVNTVGEFSNKWPNNPDEPLADSDFIAPGKGIIAGGSRSEENWDDESTKYLIMTSDGIVSPDLLQSTAHVVLAQVKKNNPYSPDTLQIPVERLIDEIKEEHKGLISDVQDNISVVIITRK